MKIAHFCTFPNGGASIAAKRLHQGLQTKKNTKSRFFYHVSWDEAVENGLEQIKFTPSRFKIPRNSKRLMWEINARQEIFEQNNREVELVPDVNEQTFTLAWQPHQTPLRWRQIRADVVNMHWVSLMADYPTFFDSIPNRIPIVWTLHDMNAFTGGCHYSNGCERFSRSCGNCPQLVRSGDQDVSAKSFSIKQTALAKKKIHVVGASDWIRKLAEKSKIWPANTTFQTIRYGVDLETLRPVDQADARAQLGLPLEPILIAFGAAEVGHIRKGSRYLTEALAHLKSTSSDSRAAAECVVFGFGDMDADADLPPVHQLGYVDSLERQALIYSAADIVVVPSIEDNQPQVGLESMACGTPVVAFDAGGIPEYVRDGETGLLAPVKDSVQLSQRIAWMIKNPDARIAMGRQARQMMEQEFELSRQADEYLELYRSVGRKRLFARAA